MGGEILRPFLTGCREAVGYHRGIRGARGMGNDCRGIFFWYRLVLGFSLGVAHGSMHLFGLGSSVRSNRDCRGHGSRLGGLELERGVYAASVFVNLARPVFGGAMELRALKRHECRAPWWGNGRRDGSLRRSGMYARVWSWLSEEWRQASGADLLVCAAAGVVKRRVGHDPCAYEVGGGRV